MKRKWRHWTDRDHELLRKFHAEGKTDEDIAYIMDRKRQGVRLHRVALGLPRNSKLGKNAGWKHTPEAKAKMSAANKKRWQDPEYRAEGVKRLRAAYPNSLKKRFRVPPLDTPEYKIYRKLRDALGRETARAELPRILDAFP